MLMRIVVFIVALFGVLAVLRVLFSARRVKSGQAGPANTQKSTPLLPCAHCGAYTPQPEGVLHNGHFYCSLEHAQAALTTQQAQQRPPQ